MLSLEDIIGMSDCTREEVEAIAIHEHVPDAIASEMASHLIHGADGIPRIREFIIEDIEFARSRGQMHQAEKLNGVLENFVASHPRHFIKTNH
jgi:hypothetical protein